MSLSGKARADNELRGKVVMPETIHGYSAYEIAVINGFRGTEVEWLASLKGAKGDKGEISTDSEFVFLGGDASRAPSVDLVVDDKLSATSPNAVKNSAVYQELENIKNDTNATKIIFPSKSIQKNSSDEKIHQGDFTIIKTKDINILIDVGAIDIVESDGDTKNHAWRTIEILKQNQVTHLDYIIISHWHNDHVGGSESQGLIDLIENASTNGINIDNLKLYFPHGKASFKATAEAAFDAALSTLKFEQNNIIYPGGTEANGSDTDELKIDEHNKLTFFNLNKEDLEYYDTPEAWVNDKGETIDKKSYNNYSMCVLFESFGNRVLFTGDIEKPAELKIAKRYPEYISNINIYKAQHHSLNTVMDETYKGYINPSVAVIMRSAHESERYATHDESAIVQHLQQCNTAIYCNGRKASGNICITCFNGSFNVSCEFQESILSSSRTLKNIAVTHTLVNGSTTGHGSLIRWCNEHVREGLQLLQIGDGINDKPGGDAVLVNALYICNDIKDNGANGRRTLIVPGREGNLYVRNYVTGTENSESKDVPGSWGWRKWFKFAGTEVTVEDENENDILGKIMTSQSE